MMLMVPDASIPIVHMSILKNEDGALHMNIGKVLEQFRDKGVLIIGSGSSFHNLDYYFASG